MLPGVFPIVGDELRNWLRTTGQGLFTGPLSGAEALSMLRYIGGAIRTSDFYDIRRDVLMEYNRQQAVESQLAEYNPNALIPAAWHSDTHGLNLSSQFLYRVRVEGFDPDTGYPKTSILSVGSDYQMTSAEVKESISSMLAADPKIYEMDVESIDIISSMARPGMWQ